MREASFALARAMLSGASAILGEVVVAAAKEGQVTDLTDAEWNPEFVAGVRAAGVDWPPRFVLPEITASVDLTDAELDVLEAHARTLCGDPNSSCVDLTGAARSLIAEVRRWRDKAAAEAGLARLTAEIRAVGSPEGAWDQWPAVGVASAEIGSADLDRAIAYLRPVGPPGGAHGPEGHEDE